MKKSSPILWILKNTRKRIPGILLLLCSTVGSAICAVFFALGTRDVIDSATSGNREAFVQACIAQGIVIAGVLICLTASRYLRERLYADLDRDWKKRLFTRLLESDYASVSAYHSGELMNRLNNDVRAVNDGLIVALPDVASIITKLIAAVGTLLVMQPTFTLILAGIGILVMLFTGSVRRNFKALQKKLSEQDGKVSSLLQESLEKLLMIQALDVSDEVGIRADEAMKNRYLAQRRRKNASLLANTSVSLMYYGAGFATLVFCSTGLITGSLSYGTMTAMTQLVNQLQTPFVKLSGTLPMYIAMVAAAERLMELEEMDTQPDAEAIDARALYAEMDGIGAEALSFSYDRDMILNEASFHMPKDCFAVITGPSGTGKSTLLKLMLGIFRPDAGELYVEQAGKRIPLNRGMRRLFAYVPQGNLLLSGTLRDNLIITRPNATEEEIQEAIYVSGMDEYLPQLPNGLDTVLGESGAGLSEGQSQRLAIARAVISGAPIILLDEGTSALDAQTEAIVLQRIHQLQDRSCIAVTHRPAAVELCDWIIEVQCGKLNAHPAR